MNLLLLLIALAMPQFLGILVHFRMKRFPKLACFTGFSITLILSLFLTLAVLFPPVEPTEPGQYVCGLAAMAAMIIILFLTGVAAIVSIIAQYYFYRKYRMS